jgi:hypothetical protein
MIKHHINLYIKKSKVRKCDIGSSKINIKMTSMYNKLWKKKINFLLLL